MSVVLWCFPLSTATEWLCCCSHQADTEVGSLCASLPAHTSWEPTLGSPSQAPVASQQFPCWGLTHNWGTRVCVHSCLSVPEHREAFAGSLIWKILGMLLLPGSSVPIQAGCAAWGSYRAVLGYSLQKGKQPKVFVLTFQPLGISLWRGLSDT